MATYQWFNQWCFPDGRVWLAFAKLGSRYLLSFPELADFFVAADGTEIWGYPKPNTPLETLRHLLLDQVIPLVLSHRGRLVLHASAVLTSKGIIAFVGQAGRGKSTLAASLAKQGYLLFSDDCLLLKEHEGMLWGFPSYPGLRLWTDSVKALFDADVALAEVAHYTPKKRLMLQQGWDQHGPEPAPVQRFYFLTSPKTKERTETVSISPLSPREAFIELISYSFKLDITNQEMLKKEFDLFSRLANLPLFYRLTFPQEFSFLPFVQELILTDTVYF